MVTCAVPGVAWCRPGHSDTEAVFSVETLLSPAEHHPVTCPGPGHTNIHNISVVLSKDIVCFLLY